MSTSLSVWLQFLVCVGLIGLAGMKLIRYGDALAELTGLSRSWIGLILVATVTSLPELVTGLSAVTVARAPDIAVGDVLGSCVFNLAILAVADAAFRRAPVFTLADAGHILPAAFGVLLLTCTVAILVLSQRGVLPQIGHVSAGSLVLVGLYGWAMRAIYQAEQQRPPSPASISPPVMSLKKALTGYALASVVIVSAGIWLPLLGVELARIMGWSNSFVGTLFIAMATSVPELATTLGALRLGAVDLAIGNLLGSNLFDVLILALDDMAYLSGPLYEQVSGGHVMSALTASAMTVLVIVALVRRPAGRVLHLASWVGTTLWLLYLLNTAFQYTPQP